jgi:hypothetical protein
MTTVRAIQVLRKLQISNRNPAALKTRHTILTKEEQQALGFAIILLANAISIRNFVPHPGRPPKKGHRQ